MKALWLPSFCFLAIASVIATNAQAEMYRWVDSEGKVHYSDTPPPPSAKKVEEKNFGGNVVPSDNLPYSVQLAVKNFPVTLYTGDCGDGCKQAQAYLTKRGIPYTQRLPGANKDDAAAFKKVSSDNLIPLLLVGKVYTLKGYSESEWANALDQAGYPRTNTFPGGKTPPPASTPNAPAAKTPAPAAPSDSAPTPANGGKGQGY